MPRQNRVTPTGQIVAHPGRGMFMGNRGCLHDEAGNLVRTHTSQEAWVTCALEFRGRKRKLMRRGYYTELFFLDEAVALAAGHRPCGECRRSDYNRFTESWTAAFGGGRPRAPELDAALSRDRWDRSNKTQVTHPAMLRDTPDGVFVHVGEPQALLYWRGALYPYAFDRYCPACPRCEGRGADATRDGGGAAGRLPTHRAFERKRVAAPEKDVSGSEASCLAPPREMGRAREMAAGCQPYQLVSRSSRRLLLCVGSAHSDNPRLGALALQNSEGACCVGSNDLTRTGLAGTHAKRSLID
jgi:hypothetical protein